MITGTFMSNIKAEATPMPIAYYNVSGKSNEDDDRETIKDLTGNGYDLKLHGFDFDKQTGYVGFVPKDFRRLFPKDMEMIFPEKYDRNEEFIHDGRVIDFGKNGPIRLHSDIMPLGKFILKFSVHNLNDFVNESGTADPSREMRIYAWNFDGTTHTYKDTLRIKEDGDYVWRTEFTEEFKRFVIQVVSDNPVDDTFTPIEYPYSIYVGQLEESRSELSFDGATNYVESIKPLPAFTDNKYTFVYDLYPFALKGPAKCIFQKDNILLYRIVNGFILHNQNSITTLDVEYSSVGITSDALYSGSVRPYPANPSTEVVPNKAGVLRLGTDSDGVLFCPITFYGMAIFDGVDLDAKMISRVFRMIRANTLLK